MKSSKLSIILSTSLLYVLIAFVFVACKKNTGTSRFGIEPASQADMTNLSLNMDGKLFKGNMPSPTGGVGGIAIVKYPDAVQVSAGVELYIPVEVSDTICAIYLQVEGASSYWKVNPTIDYANNLAILKVFVPNFVNNGNFHFVYAVGDCSGKVSSYVTTNTIVTAPLACGDAVSGSYGITINHFDLGEKSGVVHVTYDMYSIPDRIDLRWHNNWIASSGTLLSNTSYGPNYGLYPDGFVSGTNTLSFNYDPSKGHDLYVYVTGNNPSTAWDVSVDCPN